jgi:hypothetical protein
MCSVLSLASSGQEVRKLVPVLKRAFFFPEGGRGRHLLLLGASLGHSCSRGLANNCWSEKRNSRLCRDVPRVGTRQRVVPGSFHFKVVIGKDTHPLLECVSRLFRLESGISVGGQVGHWKFTLLCGQVCPVHGPPGSPRCSCGCDCWKLECIAARYVWFWRSYGIRKFPSGRKIPMSWVLCIIDVTSVWVALQLIT